MRDERDFKRTERSVTTTTFPSGAVTVNDGFSDVQSVRSFRSDSISTRSVNGKWFQPTPYHALFYLTSSGYAYARYHDNQKPSWRVHWDKGISGVTELNWRIGITTNLTPDVPNHVLAACRQSILDAVRDSDINVAQTSGEMRETISGLHGLSKDLTKLAMGLSKAALAFRSHPLSFVKRYLSRKGGGELASGLTKHGAREYLRFMYGIRPIMMDAHGFASQAAKGLGVNPIGSLKKRQTENVNLSSYDKYYASAPWVRHQGKVEVGVEIGLDYFVSNPALFELDRYGLTNPLALAWELTTLSFVVDWFTGLGNFIRGMTQPMGCIARNGYETRFTDANYQIWQRVATVPVQYVILVDGSAVCQVTGLCMFRSLTLGFTPPVPYLKLDLNKSQVLSTLALLTTFVKR